MMAKVPVQTDAACMRISSLGRSHFGIALQVRVAQRRGRKLLPRAGARIERRAIVLHARMTRQDRAAELIAATPHDHLLAGPSGRMPDATAGVTSSRRVLVCRPSSRAACACR